jgi:predicted ATPase
MSAAKKTKVWYLPALGKLFAECRLRSWVPHPWFLRAGLAFILAYAHRDSAMSASRGQKVLERCSHEHEFFLSFFRSMYR